MSRQLSIKARLTLWFAVFLVLLAAFSLVVLTFGSSTLLKRDAESILTETVEANALALSYTDGQLTLGEAFRFYANGVYTVIYDRNGVYLAGQVPVGVAVGEPLAEGAKRAMEADGEAYYLYDRKVIWDDGNHLWLRGIALEEGPLDAAGLVVRLALAAMPFLLLLAVAGGYVLAKRALDPVERIGRAAASINEGRDLSARIGLPPGEDEVHRLAATFDSMFARLEQSFEAEKAFTANASHELRTPITVILAQCDALEKGAPTEEELLAGLGVIKRQANKMSQLVSALLSLSRLDRGVEKAYLEWTNVSELADVICKQLGRAKGRTVALSVQSDCYAWADAGLLARALENLLDNAFKYGGPSGEVRVTVFQEAAEIVLSVADDGVGIDPKEQARIWERFYQADASRSGDGGLGLGLAMVEQIVRLHGGHVGVESAPGSGSTFWLRLPVGTEAPASCGETTSKK